MRWVWKGFRSDEQTMIAVVESGSTKSDWRIIGRDGEVKATYTAGFNPYHVSSGQIEAEVRANGELSALSDRIDRVHFYGAGCSSDAMNEVVAQALRSVFVNADVHVDHDMLGAALAAGQGSACIVGILGTGSNACRFDGRNIDNGRPSLGYILGDEASGAWFGKRVISDHLHGLLPDAMHRTLNEVGVTKEAVLHRVYLEPRPNTYLAGFMPLLSDYRGEAYVQNLLNEGFCTFLQRYVCFFPEHRELETHLVGSVAHHFADELRSAAGGLGLRMGRIVHRPIDALVAYHST